MAPIHIDNLTGEHRTGDIGQLILFCLFMALWISDIFLEYSGFLNEYIPVVVKLPIGIFSLEMSKEQLIDFASILGNDYCHGVSGIKPLDAYHKFKEVKSKNMNNYESLEEEIKKKLKRQEKTKKRKMKVNGKGVFGLKKIITKKSKSSQNR